ncbi:MAG: hypothetical protein ACRBHB_24795 [Arenicella sp.]
MTIVTRIFEKDSSLWSQDQTVQALIDNRLGWLEAVSQFQQRQAEILTLVEHIKADGFKHVIVLGMGGSALAPEVFSKLFPQKPDSLELLVLDSMCVEQILDFEQRVDLEKTLFIVSSKSGGTIETMSLFHYFYDRVPVSNSFEKGQQFIAITDEGSGLEQLASQYHFRQCFINPSDIGGRFSALSYFGLVPAALLGLSLDKLLSRAAQAVQDCHASIGAGVKLGQWLVQGYETRHLDKLVIQVPEDLAPLVWWIEQLVAESLGKQGQGILPVLKVGDDFQMLPNSKCLCIERAHKREDFSDLNKAYWNLVDDYDVAAHFFHWEFAVALAGATLKINPFDEPNVTEAKVRTKQLLERAIETNGMSLSEASPQVVPLAELLSELKPDSYISILAYWPINASNDHLLQQLSIAIEQKTQSPVTVNYGPRYLHSTGQLHKGGKSQGIFIVLTQNNVPDLTIPGQPYSFNMLCRAQALGDFQILREKGLPSALYNLDDISDLSVT